MKKHFILFVVGLLSSNSYSQVGIKTNTPTETLDIDGTLRVRTLPDNGTIGIHTTPSGTASQNPDQLFKAQYPVVADANGVLGIVNNEKLIPNNTIGTSFTTNNDSEAYFVIKRYHLYDNVGGAIGRYHPNYTGGSSTGIFDGDTGMKVDNWQAMISNISYKFLTATSDTQAQFKKDDYFNYRLKGASGGTRKIIGDIINLQEQAYVDVLFIKSNYVAAEDRSL